MVYHTFPIRHLAVFEYDDGIHWSHDLPSFISKLNKLGVHVYTYETGKLAYVETKEEVQVISDLIEKHIATMQEDVDYKLLEIIGIGSSDYTLKNHSTWSYK